MHRHTEQPWRASVSEHALVCDARLAVLVAARLLHPRMAWSLALRCAARRPRVCVALLRGSPTALERHGMKHDHERCIELGWCNVDGDVSHSAHCLTSRRIRLIAAVLTGLTVGAKRTTAFFDANSLQMCFKRVW